MGRGQGVLSVPEAQARRRRLRLDPTTPALLGLPLAWLAVFFLVPIAIVGLYSVGRLSLDPGPHAVTLAAWHDFLHSPVYLKLFWKSVKMSLVVSIVVVALAYPLAYYLALSGTKRKYVLLLLLIAPFLTSYLLRVLAWKVILGNQGVINSFLFSTGLRSPDHPISQLLYSRFAVMLVLGYIWLPFVALPIFVTLESLDRRLFEAATDLGASRWQTFRRVTLPLSLPGRDGRVPVRLHPDPRRVRHALARRRCLGLHVRQPDRRPVRDRLPRLADRLGARALPARRGRRADDRLLALPADTRGDRGMNVALSRTGAWVLRSFFALVVIFLYAPIAILVLFSFNDSQLPSFPLSGFTLHWYHQFLVNADLRSALETSAVVAAISSVGAVLLGVLASIALVRRRFRLKSPVSALLLSPLVIPYVVFGISLLLFFHAAGIPRSVLTVVIGHIVISLPYTILVLMPRLQQIDVSLEEAAYDLGASRLRAFRSVTLPLLLPAVVSAYLIAFTTSFDEYAVASFVVGTRSTFPIFLYSALRFPNQLPQVIAVAVVVISVSLVVVIGAEVGRRVAERRLG